MSGHDQPKRPVTVLRNPHLHECFRQELGQYSAKSVVVTASMGVTAIAAEDRSYEDTLKRADRALYDAKNLGKDRIVSA